jgi:hypothetical protein
MPDSNPTTQPDYPTLTTRYLLIYALMTCVLAAIAWIRPGLLAVTTNLGVTELFVLSAVGYLLLGIVLFLQFLGLPNRYILNAVFIGICVCCLIYLTTQILLLLPNHKIVWDDALMFWRYIYNIKTHGMVAWNIADGPAYGSTELVHLGAALLMSYVKPESPHLIMMFTTIIEGCIFMVAMTMMIWRMSRLGVTGKLAVMTLIYIGLLWHVAALRYHFVTGMGTMLVLTHTTIYAMLARWNETVQTPRSRLITGVWGGLAYYVRPDLMLFSVIVPAIFWCLAKNPAQRGNALRLLGLTLGIAGVLAGLAWVGLGSPVPLSFFVKSTNLYGDSYIYILTAKLPQDQLIIFVNNSFFLLICVALGCLAPGRAVSRWQATGIGLLLAACLYAAYYLFFVMQMMYFEQRFYYPLLPVVIYLAAGGLSVLETIPAKFSGWLRHYQLHVQATASAWLLVLVIFFFPTQLPLIVQSAFHPDRNPLEAPDREFFAKDWSKHWFELWEFSHVSPTLVIATTEVGIPAILNPEWYVYDLSGLNNAKMALNGFSMDDLLAHQPDFIYIPWREYTVMFAAVMENPEFQQQYTLFYGWDVHSPFDIAVRNNSPHYAKIVRIIELGAQQRQPEPK